MIELKIKSFKEMSLKTYYELDKLKNKKIDAVDFEIELISILCECSVNDILDLTISEYQAIRAEAQFVADFPDIVPNCPDNMTINGHKYAISKDLSKVTTAQYIDFQNYLKMENNVQYVLSCFLIPEGKKYGQGYNVDDVINDIMDLDIIDALTVCFFFINLYLTSIKVILHSLESKTKKEIKKTKNKEMKKQLMKKLEEIHLLINGVG